MAKQFCDVPEDKESYTLTYSQKWLMGICVKGVGSRIPLDISSLNYDVSADFTKIDVLGDDNNYHDFDLSETSIINSNTSYSISNPKSTTLSLTPGQAYLYRVTGTITVTSK